MGNKLNLYHKILVGEEKQHFTLSTSNLLEKRTGGTKILAYKFELDACSQVALLRNWSARRDDGKKISSS